MDLKEKIRIISNFKGVEFVDISTLLKEGPAFHKMIDCLAQSYGEQDIDLVAGPEWPAVLRLGPQLLMFLALDLYRYASQGSYRRRR